MRLVIIGNGMAATRLIASLTGRAADRFAITVIGDEPEHAYNRIQLSPVLGGEKTAACSGLRRRLRWRVQVTRSRLFIAVRG